MPQVREQVLMATPYKHPTMPRKKTRKPKVNKTTQSPFPRKRAPRK